MKNKKLSVLMWLLLAMAGCANRVPQAPAATAKQVAMAGTLDDLWIYHRSLKRLSQQELAHELQALNARQGGAMLAMEKALVLGLTHDSADLVRAQVQLNNVLTASDAEADKFKPLAELLRGNYVEMRRLAENADKANQQSRESQRRLDQLNEKLEALKNIERTLPGTPR